MSNQYYLSDNRIGLKILATIFSSIRFMLALLSVAMLVSPDPTAGLLCHIHGHKAPPAISVSSADGKPLAINWASYPCPRCGKVIRRGE